MIREFKTFIAVARGGTFTGAGRRLGLTQSAVSAQIKRLEEHLGVALFERTGKSAALNHHGRSLLPQAEALVAMADRVVGMAGAGRVSGLLRVGAIASVQQDLLVRALAALRAEHPDVRVRIVPGVSLTLLGHVDAGEVDLAVLIRPPFALPPELEWQPLLREPMVLAVPEAAPEGPWRELLAGQPFIRYDRASFGGRLVDMFLKRHRLDVREAIELDEIDAIANLVRHGLGVALLPHTRHLDARGLRLLELDDQVRFAREIGLIVRQPLGQSPLAQRLAQCLRAAVSFGEA
ncbi:LysR substrate-binding domain protein [Bordetella bronchiseptica GA96-01]|uniref:LysR family transcriptional regulator n=1 Tax=Bordetella bronchiseptica TaxID=518 RepID=UPI00045B9D38|nr:LysR family transcriptional regulator [Bordetella bronchiseptica]AZW32833.1 LysR family transcriptional regulator [Bordetella bronchiseptica]KCV42081.1 LysR substrate-binding domain protein [Bordetella bronchiseptica 345]KCV51007.1 LysR substrate-binding domain protein [Bordetella bronchiseptica 7E71]KDC40924.1 LysR substrate-binding domain protein [Bordetella bronchiseptica GA96-01]